MPIQAFLVIPPKPGNPPISATPSTDPYFSANVPNAAVIEIRDFEFAVENPAVVGSQAGAGAGKERLDQLLIHKVVDRISPALFSASASGGHFAVMHLYVRQDSAGPAAAQGAPFLVYEFQTVFITNITWSGSGGDAQPAEAVTFTYGALVIAYKATNPDGSLGQVAKGGWSQVTNTGNVPDTIPM